MVVEGFLAAFLGGGRAYRVHTRFLHAPCTLQYGGPGRSYAQRARGKSHSPQASFCSSLRDAVDRPVPPGSRIVANEEEYMRIAQLAPPLERVPPSGYGGTERVISTLTEELVRRGHQVTLFASGDSQTSAR